MKTPRLGYREISLKAAAGGISEHELTAPISLTGSKGGLGMKRTVLKWGNSLGRTVGTKSITQTDGSPGLSRNAEEAG